MPKKITKKKAPKKQPPVPFPAVLYGRRDHDGTFIRYHKDPAYLFAPNEKGTIVTYTLTKSEEVQTSLTFTAK